LLLRLKLSIWHYTENLRESEFNEQAKEGINNPLPLQALIMPHLFKKKTIFLKGQGGVDKTALAGLNTWLFLWRMFASLFLFLIIWSLFRQSQMKPLLLNTRI